MDTMKELEIVWDYPAGFGGVAGILIRGRQEEQNQRQESREGATLGRGGRGYRSPSAEAGRDRGRFSSEPLKEPVLQVSLDFSRTLR